MPIYEYRCQKCHNVFEEWLKHSDDTTSAPCPNCRSEAERIISNTSFMLKGGGWYATEYGNRKQDAPAQCAASKDSGGEAGTAAPACASGCGGGTCPAAASSDAS